MLRVLLIGAFGFLGTVARYLMQGAVRRLSAGTFPYGTLAVNVLGSFIVGFGGGFTTYSAFAYETFELLRTGDPFRGLANIAAQLVLGLTAVWLGYAAAMKL